MFEPIHGSAPEIAGQEKANPIAAMVSAGMLLKGTGRRQGDTKMQQAGDAIEAAVKRVCPRFTGMPMDRLPMKTKDVADLVLAEI